MKDILAIITGGGLGAISRYSTNILIGRMIPTAPLFAGTMAVNLVGSFLIGLCAALMEHYKIAVEYRLFLLTGFLGSFTTFSAFAREKTDLIKVGEMKTAFFYLAGTNVFGIILVFAGYYIASKITEMSGY